MGKKHTKSEKLDLILSELSKLKAIVKKLRDEQAASSKQGAEARSKSTPAKRGKIRKRTVARKRPAETVTPSKPVLVPATPDAATG
jgi:hypothetical protein